MIQFGEKIILKDFKEYLQPGEITILKKIIGNNANKLGDFKKLTFHLKNIHKKEKSTKYQINAQLESEKERLYEAEATHFNLFFAINSIFEKLKKELDKETEAKP